MYSFFRFSLKWPILLNWGFVLISISIFISVVRALDLDKDESCIHETNSFRCVEYVRNYDADTITFNIPNVHFLIGREINIRVYGVDTPELRSKNSCEKTKAKKVQKIVESLLENSRRIDLENIQRGKYFRIVANVIIDGVSLSSYLLENGLAYIYFGGKKKKINWCKSHHHIIQENQKISKKQILN